jgi:hypothetical protein
MFSSIVGVWLPLALIFGAAWITGELFSTFPSTRAPRHTPLAT